MDIEEIKKILNELKAVIRKEYKAEIVGVFGSFARGEGGEKSDIDILVEFQGGATLLDLVGLSDFLEEKLKREVDVVSTKALRKEIEKHVMKDIVSI